MSYIVLDIECSKKPAFKPWHKDSFLSSIGIEDMEGNYKDWFFNPEVGDATKSLEEIAEIIKNTDVIVGHNVKFDALWLMHIGMDLSNVTFYCTEIAEYFILGHASSKSDGVSLSLNGTAARYELGHKVDAMKEYWDSGVNTDQIPLPIHKEYLQQDVHLTHELFKKQIPIITKAELTNVVMLSFDVLKVLATMEFNGVPLDMDYAEQLRIDFDAKINTIDTDLLGLAKVPFSPDSSQQLSAVLYGGTWKVDGREEYEVVLKSGEVKQKSRKCKVEVSYPGLGFDVPDGMTSDKTGIGKTSKEAIALLSTNTEIKKNFIALISKRRSLAKALSTLFGKNNDAGFVSKLGVDGKLHPNFNQTVTRTGRLSSSEPNGQNLPRGGTSPIKRCILPTMNNIVNIDFGQIEWRMAAALSLDPVMVQETLDGIDVHSFNARAFFGADKYAEDSKEFKDLRQAAKTLAFRLLYGGSGYAFFMDQRMPRFTLPKWENIVKQFYEKYKGLKAWQDKNYQEVTQKGYLRTPSGRILTYDMIRNRDGSMSYDRKQICNYSVQSISADIMFLAMKYTQEYLITNKLRTKILLSVHDSLVLDVPDEEVELICKDVLTIFKNIPIYTKEHFNWDIVVPITGDCEVGKNYGELNKVL